MKPAAIIFDCDGVLADSEPQANRVLSEVLAEFGILMTPDECREAFVGLNPAGVAAKVLSTRGVDLRRHLTGIVVPRFMTLLRAEGLRPVPGAADAIVRVLSVGARTAVASNSPRPELELKLELTGLRGHFGPHVHSGDELGRSKPDPGVYLHAAAELGLPPSSCVVVEDTPTGVRAGLAAGMRVLGFTGAHGGPANATELLAAGADLTFDSLADVTRLAGLT
ncbi:MAG: HAD family phosphatase [Leptolyngbya sp. PLA1]|nr:HAD family phosphatase [Leptolyngbya sp. PLA1]